MKYLKYLLYIVIAIILIYVILCFIGPKDLSVVKTTEIESSASIPFNLVNNLEKTELWNDWTMNDTTLITEYNEITTGVGSSSSWVSKLTGEGTQEIIESIANTSVKSELNFKGWDGENYAEFQFSEKGVKTDVSYSFEGSPLPFLIRGFGLLTGMKKSMNTSYEKCLSNLKKLSEERAQGIYNGFEIKEVDLGERHFIMNRQEVQSANIQQFYATNLGALFTKAQGAGIEMTGMPCGLYFSSPMLERETIDMAAAIPIGDPVSVKDATTFTLPAKRAITLDFYGDYSSIGIGHNAIKEYMNDRSYLPDPPVVEEYVTDPGEEPDPNKWLTKMTQYFSLSR